MMISVDDVVANKTSIFLWRLFQVHDVSSLHQGYDRLLQCLANCENMDNKHTDIIYPSHALQQEVEVLDQRIPDLESTNASF